MKYIFFHLKNQVLIKLLKIPSFFRQTKNRSFSFEPRFYDEKKERIERKIDEIKEKIEKKKGVNISTLKIEKKIKRKIIKQREANNQRGKRVIILIALFLIIAFYYLK